MVIFIENSENHQPKVTGQFTFLLKVTVIDFCTVKMINLAVAESFPVAVRASNVGGVFDVIIRFWIIKAAPSIPCAPPYNAR